MLKTSHKVVLIIRFVSADEFNHFIPEIFILFVIHVTVVLFVFIPGSIPFLYSFNGPFTHPDAFLCFIIIRFFLLVHTVHRVHLLFHEK